MSFTILKQQYLKQLEDNLKQQKKDKSKKGFPDEQIKELLAQINNNDNYYTTSSCAGRTVIIRLGKGNKKDKSEWLFSSHKPVQKISETIIEKITGDCWLKFEPCILHVCCKDLESALAFIDTGKKVGFKRGGIYSISKDDRIIVEISGVDRIDVPLANNNGLLVSKEYMQFLLDECNKKMKRNNERIKMFYQLLKK